MHYDKILKNQKTKVDLKTASSSSSGILDSERRQLQWRVYLLSKVIFSGEIFHMCGFPLSSPVGIRLWPIKYLQCVGLELEGLLFDHSANLTPILYI